MKKKSYFRFYNTIIKKCGLSIIIFILMVPIAKAEPSKLISRMMITPASVFDIFLSQMLEDSKCPFAFLSDRYLDYPRFCMFNITYDFNDNVIIMLFLIALEHDKMVGFEHSHPKDQEAQLKGILLDDVAEFVGVGKLNEFGLIQRTPIHRGWSTKDIDEKETRNEILKRTYIILKASIGNFTYRATRDHYGNVSYKKGGLYEPWNLRK